MNKWLLHPILIISPWTDLHVLRGPAAVHRPREPPLGAPERAAHGRREAAGRAPRLQTPQVTIPPRPPDRQHNSLNIEGISEEIRLGIPHIWRPPCLGYPIRLPTSPCPVNSKPAPKDITIVAFGPITIYVNVIYGYPSRGTPGCRRRSEEEEKIRGYEGQQTNRTESTLAAADSSLNLNDHRVI